jgi:hypothetical protein
VQQVWVCGVDGGPAIATISVTTGNYACLCGSLRFPADLRTLFLLTSNQSAPVCADHFNRPDFEGAG